MLAVLAPSPCVGKPFTTRASQRHGHVSCMRVRSSLSDEGGLPERFAKGAAAAALSVLLSVGGASARLEGVNKPELLPTGAFTPVIDVAGFLTDGEVCLGLPSAMFDALLRQPRCRRCFAALGGMTSSASLATAGAPDTRACGGA